MRVVPPLREERDNREVDDRDWRPSRNHRSKARLAEERRRLDHDNGWPYGDAPDAPVESDTYHDVHEELYDLHDDAFSGRMTPEANDSHWNLGPESDLYETSAGDYGYYRSRKPTSFWKMAVSVTAAVITGLLFGYMVLSMFNGGDAGKNPATGQLESSDAGNLAPTDPSGERGHHRRLI